MSTRANIRITDGYDTLWFYRHSDGYPESEHGVLKFLEPFMDRLKDGTIRNNAMQAAGWLIVLGRDAMLRSHNGYDASMRKTIDSMYNWKVGLIEPTTERHGDIDYLYTIDLKNQTLEYEKVW